ncbi:MAG TPA: isoamylase early set domain-containing protein [Caldilineaceae bacterium]|nr:isoamylase early set domain-containing protein [Caldilineaceae bacterium]HRW06981.1 isoamylase early set domain-containing protein [Caldilineaceae bacterium]
MIIKRFIQQNGRDIAQVTFCLPANKWSSTVHLVGDFNQWNQHTHPFHQTTDGAWTITVELPSDQIYQFRYLCDGHEWLTDRGADGYIPNVHGSENCLLITKRDFQPHTD